VFSKQATSQSTLLPGSEYFNCKQLKVASHVPLEAIQAIISFRQLTRQLGRGVPGTPPAKITNFEYHIPSHFVTS